MILFQSGFSFGIFKFEVHRNTGVAPTPTLKTVFENNYYKMHYISYVTYVMEVHGCFMMEHMIYHMRSNLWTHLVHKSIHAD